MLVKSVTIPHFLLVIVCQTLGLSSSEDNSIACQCSSTLLKCIFQSHFTTLYNIITLDTSISLYHLVSCTYRLSPCINGYIIFIAKSSSHHSHHEYSTVDLLRRCCLCLYFSDRQYCIFTDTCESGWGVVITQCEPGNCTNRDRNRSTSCRP